MVLTSLDVKAIKRVDDDLIVWPDPNAGLVNITLPYTRTWIPLRSIPAGRHRDWQASEFAEYLKRIDKSS